MRCLRLSFSLSSMLVALTSIPVTRAFGQR
jgi:hypothetical protein